MRSPSIFATLCYAILIAACLPSPAHGQISYGGTPEAFSRNLPVPPVHKLSWLDNESLKQQRAETVQPGLPRPFQFGHGRTLQKGLRNSGAWHLMPDGSRIWRLRLESAGAESINLTFDQFFIPPGGRLFIYTPDGEFVLGAFTEKNNTPDLSFATTPLPGDAIVLEYLEPAEARGHSRLNIATLVHGFEDTFSRSPSEASSSSCYRGINCYEASSWGDEKRAVMKIIVNNGKSLCTGFLVNDTQLFQWDVYAITARHCKEAEGDPPVGSKLNWLFIFNYEGSCCNCSNGNSNQSMYQAFIKAQRSRDDSDFLLLALKQVPPPSYNAYLAGWDARPIVPKHAYGIHHPAGLVKKFSRDTNLDAYQSTGIGSENDLAGLRTIRFVVDWDDPWHTAGGSSGSPLFSDAGRVVGQLWGNVPWSTDQTCQQDTDWYGRISASWNGPNKQSRLKDWLLPTQKWRTFLDGKNPAFVNAPTPFQKTSATDVTKFDVAIKGPEWVNSHELSSFIVSSNSEETPLHSFKWWHRPTDGNVLHWTKGGDVVSDEGFSVALEQDAFVKVEARSSDGQMAQAMIKVTVADRPERPVDSALSMSVYPTPAIDKATLIYSVPKEGEVAIRIYNAIGKEVYSRKLGRVSPGEYHVNLNVADLSSGLYYVSLMHESTLTTQKLALVR